VNAALGASPLVLTGGFGLAELRAAYDTLENQVMEMSALIEAARAGRGERDAMIAALIERMVQYQNAAAAALGEQPEVAKMIPLIYERQMAPPDAVALAGAWSREEAGARLTWGESDGPDFSSYPVRARPGTDAPTDADDLIATVTDRAQTTLLVDRPYAAGRDVWTFRVWVVDKHDHVAASHPVTVRRE
jgi:hypothetical protein